MKKLIAVLMALILAASFAACGKTETPEPAPETSAPETTAAAPVGDVSPAQMLWADFQEKYAEDKDLTELANELISNEAIPYMCGAMPVEAGYLTGLGTVEIDGFTEGVQFMPMIGSIPFIGYLFRVDGSVDDFMNILRGNADLRWNICTEADEMVCDAIDNTVFFVMAPATFEEN